MRAMVPFLPLLLALPAAAETGQSCAFSVGCEAAGSCAPVTLQAEIGLGEAGALAFLSSDAAPLPAAILSADDAPARAFALAETGTGARLITIHADGTAVMSRHPADPGAPAMTYFGTCEET